MKILYVTSNEKKVKELKEILKKSMEIDTIDSLFDLDYEPIDKNNELDLQKSAFNKGKTAWKKEKDNYDYIIAEESGFYLEHAPNILGINLDTWWPGTDRDRCEALIRLFDGVKERQVFYKTVFITFNKKGDNVVSEGYNYGYLARKVKEKNGSGYDSVMLLEDGKYLSQHTSEEISRVSSRTQAIHSLVEKIEKDF